MESTTPEEERNAEGARPKTVRFAVTFTTIVEMIDDDRATEAEAISWAHFFMMPPRGHYDTATAARLDGAEDDG